MREFTAPPVAAPSAASNLSDYVFENPAVPDDSVSFLKPRGSDWEPVTRDQFKKEVRELAAGLISAGVAQGDRVAILCSTRYEWSLLDFGIWTAGCVPVPIYDSSSPDQIQWILSDSEAVAIFVEASTNEASVAEIRAQVPALQHVWVLEGGAIATLGAAGRSVDAQAIENRRKSLTRDDPATIIYTSGTTGRPKGCELTHGNFIAEADAACQCFRELLVLEARTVLFLPLAHVFARDIEVCCIRQGTAVALSGDIKMLRDNLASVHPTFILAVPRVFEKIYNGAKQKAHADGKGKIFDRAEAVAIAYSEQLQDNGKVRLGVRIQHIIFSKIVYGKLAAAFGGSLLYGISGGAPLGARLGHFFRGIGVTICEGYGLTETAAGHTVNEAGGQYKIGTVGRPLPGFSVRIADDGEILLKGGNVFRGYWRNPEATAEAVDSEGWFRSGDVGQLDAEGFLRITGRKKEILVTAGGKNVAPAPLEDVIRSHRLISQVMVVGDKRPFVAALVTIDEEAWPAWAESNGKSGDLADNVSDSALLAEVQGAVDQANKTVSHTEAIKKFAILPVDFSEDSGTMTPSLKVKRNVVAVHFVQEIDNLYTV